MRARRHVKPCDECGETLWFDHGSWVHEDSGNADCARCAWCDEPLPPEPNGVGGLDDGTEIPGVRRERVA